MIAFAIAAPSVYNVALEALRLGVRSGKAKPGEIAKIAKALRIWTVLRPYLESVAADDA